MMYLYVTLHPADRRELLAAEPALVVLHVLVHASDVRLQTVVAAEGLVALITRDPVQRLLELLEGDDLVRADLKVLLVQLLYIGTVQAYSRLAETPKCQITELKQDVIFAYNYGQLIKY